MRGHDVGDAFIRVFISFAALNGTIKHEYSAVVRRFEDEDILEFRSLRVKYLLDHQSLRHALPLVANFAEPSICGQV